MKKILIILHGKTFPRNAFDFACKLNEQEPVLLIALVLPNVIDIPNWAAYSAESAGNLEDTVMEDNIRALEELGLNEGIEVRIHRGTNEPALPQIIKECRFADLLVVGHDHFFTELEHEDPYSYLEPVLRQLECPALVVHGPTSQLDNIILAYDGKEASVYAIKQFAYLFPTLCNLPTYLTYIHGKNGESVPYETAITELVSCHFKKYEVNSLNTTPQNYLKSIGNMSNCLVVAGAFNRPAVAEFFHQSFAEDIIKKYRLPLFLAHP